MKLEFLPGSLSKIFDAIDYYEEKQRGLGNGFAAPDTQDWFRSCG